jgi:hypothetical protein
LRSRKYIPMLMLLALLSCAGKAGAQTVAMKSDLLTGGMLASPNLCVELKLSERFTLEAGVHYNPFPAGGDKRWKHWFVQPELRYSLRRTFLRGRPDVRRVQRSQGKAAFRAFQRGTFRKIRGRLYGSGNIIRLSLHPLPPLGTGDKHRRRIPAHPIRTLPLRALRRKDRKRKQEFHRSHQSLHILSVYDTIITR